MAKNPDRAMLNTLYAPPKGQFTRVDVPEMPFLMIDGGGNPEDEVFTKAVKWIWTAVYPLRLEARKRAGKNFIEPPLECLWWADNMQDFIEGNKDKWKWRLMIPAPDWAEPDMYQDALAQATPKLGEPPKSLQLRTFEEGRCIQTMHIGPPSGLAEIAAKLHADYLPQNNLEAIGPHHEIYLNDPTRVSPEKVKTILRQPVRDKSQIS